MVVWGFQRVVNRNIVTKWVKRMELLTQTLARNNNSWNASKQLTGIASWTNLSICFASPVQSPRSTQLLLIPPNLCVYRTTHFNLLWFPHQNLWFQLKMANPSSISPLLLLRTSKYTCLLVFLVDFWHLYVGPCCEFSVKTV